MRDYHFNEGSSFDDLMAFLVKRGANTCSIPYTGVIAYGYARKTVSGNVKGYTHLGRIRVTPNTDDCNLASRIAERMEKADG